MHKVNLNTLLMVPCLMVPADKFVVLRVQIHEGKVFVAKVIQPSLWKSLSFLPAVWRACRI